jgi:chemotaxis family two-component system sensor kinase Cph1
VKQTTRTSRAAGSTRVKGTIRPTIEKPAGGPSTSVHTLVHLLEVNQLELEHQNQELRIAEAELETSRMKYVNLFDLSPIPLFVLGPDGAMKEVNICASRMLGIDRRKLVGKRFLAHIERGDHNVFTTFLKNVFISPMKHSCKVLVIRKDKRLMRVQLEGLKLESVVDAEQECQIALIDLTAYTDMDKE